MSKTAPRKYGVAFYTEGVADGYIKAITVTIGEEIMDAKDTIRVDLVDDPLYKELQRYLVNNPRFKRKT